MNENKASANERKGIMPFQTESKNPNPQIKTIKIILHECKFIFATCASSEYEKEKKKLNWACIRHCVVLLSSLYCDGTLDLNCVLAKDLCLYTVKAYGDRPSTARKKIIPEVHYSTIECSSSL